MRDDLNTPLAFSELHVLAKQINNADDNDQRAVLKGALLQCASSVGLLQQEPKVWFGAGDSQLDEEMINALIIERNQARASKDFAAADRIRDQLSDLGIEILDRPEGTTWRKV